MEDPVKEDRFHRAAIRRICIPFEKSLRNRLGERYPVPVESSLFAVFFIYRRALGEFRRTRQSARSRKKRTTSAVSAKVLKSFIIIFCAVLVLSGPAKKAHAVPIQGGNFDAAWYSIDSSRAGWDLYGYYLVGLTYPGRSDGYFNEGDNIEWIYDALENQYAFLDDTLYRIMGGSYLLGPVCYPLWHGFRCYAWTPNPDTEIIFVGNAAAAPLQANVEAFDSGNTLTFATRQGEEPLRDYLWIRRDITGWPLTGNRIDVDAKVIPEPSTIVLFGIVALQVRRYKRNGGH